MCVAARVPVLLSNLSSCRPLELRDLAVGRKKTEFVVRLYCSVLENERDFNNDRLSFNLQIFILLSQNENTKTFKTAGF